MAIRLESRPRRSEDVLAQQGAGTTFLLHVQDGEYYALCEIGHRIWQLCDGQHSVDEMASILCDEYDTTQQILEADVLDLLAELASHKLLIIPT